MRPWFVPGSLVDFSRDRVKTLCGLAGSSFGYLEREMACCWQITALVQEKRNQLRAGSRVGGRKRSTVVATPELSGQ